ncbi:DUF6461 domain-containing protein [Nonomuraea sp. SYSU D8015]|uniref:DUF6461 domain-containing protein n=1 Tax=Nonomuraea sp. SYSU D8015 TaxID=2593644 RepID=UPI001CB73CDE
MAQGRDNYVSLVSVLRHDYATDLFVYAIDGDRLTSFDPRKPAWRYGSDPDRLLDTMRQVGIDPTYLPGGDVTGDGPYHEHGDRRRL